jgi:hypothetical protein
MNCTHTKPERTKYPVHDEQYIPVYAAQLGIVNTHEEPTRVSKKAHDEHDAPLYEAQPEMVGTHKAPALEMV